MRGLGFESYVCHFCLLIIWYYFNIYIKHVVECYNNRVILVSMKYELVEWFGIELTIAWVGVQTLEGPK